MKIFIGKNFSCGLNYQYEFILKGLIKKFDITKEVEEADIIVIAGTCACTELNIYSILKYINDILKKKKKSSKIYLSGCITRPFKDVGNLKKVEKWLKNNVDVIIPHNNPNLLLKEISNDYENLKDDEFGMSIIDKKRDEVELFISNGCNNNCSFCKVSYQSYPLKSANMTEIKEQIDFINEEGYSKILVKGTNVCQYGVDNYGEYLLPEVLEYIEKKKNIENVGLVGFAFKDAIQNGFESTLASSKKVTFINGSLESGSDRILKLIRKGFTSQEIINFVNAIREKYYKTFYFNIIAGFPTETKEDIRITLKVLKELRPYAVDICKYINSEFVDSNKYPQLSSDEIKEHARIYSKMLKKDGVLANIE